MIRQATRTHSTFPSLISRSTLARIRHQPSRSNVARGRLPGSTVMSTNSRSTVCHSSRALDIDLDGGIDIENVLGTEYDDHIYGNSLDNTVYGLGGDDRIYTYGGTDTLYGGMGNDNLRGGEARDLIFGEMGRDELFGEGGDDFLHGGYDGSNDKMTGGEGADEFVQYDRYVFSSFPYFGYSRQLVEGEDLQDYNSSEDEIIKYLVWY